jgi:hypothetical protein
MQGQQFPSATLAEYVNVIGQEKGVQNIANRSSLGLLPPETLASVTINGNETFSAESAFGLSFKTPKVETPAPSQGPFTSPPSPYKAEEQAISEFNRLRLSESARPGCTQILHGANVILFTSSPTTTLSLSPYLSRTSFLRIVHYSSKTI